MGFLQVSTGKKNKGDNCSAGWIVTEGEGYEQDIILPGEKGTGGD